MSDGVALEQARSLVYTAEADIPQYRRAVAQTRLSLDILLGETPRRTDSAGAGLRLLTDYRPADIPVGLPSEPARTAARHHAGALRHARRSRRSGHCPRQPVPIHCSDGQRRSSLQFDQRFNFGQPLGVGCVRLADAPRLQFRQTSPRGTGRHGTLHAVGADLRADRADGLFRRRAGAGGHHHLPQTDRTLRRAWSSPTTALPR